MQNFTLKELLHKWGLILDSSLREEFYKAVNAPTLHLKNSNIHNQQLQHWCCFRCCFSALMQQFLITALNACSSWRIDRTTFKVTWPITWPPSSFTIWWLWREDRKSVRIASQGHVIFLILAAFIVNFTWRTLWKRDFFHGNCKKIKKMVKMW